MVESPLNSETPSIESKSQDEVESERNWDIPGFHRPLAGILFNLVFIFVAAGFGILFSIWLMPNVIYPFPEGMGFEDLTVQMFAVYFTVLDLGIGAAIQRFVAEENIKTPKAALQYIQFFIWYQMTSGLLQVTIIAIWVLYFLPATELAYAAWFFILYSTIQYPGMLGVFKGTLEAYQRFDRSNILGVIQTQVFENITRIICILTGRWLGRNNPAIGELMGAVMGSIIGKYLKDFITALLAAHWVSPILREIDPSYKVRHLFFHQFDSKTIKKCLSFGLRALAPGLISPLSNFIIIMMYVRWLPNYSTILGLYLLGESLAHLVATFQFGGIASTFSESYFNGKKNLTKYYLNQAYHWSAIISCFMIGLLLFGASLIGIVAGSNFYLVTPIIQNFIFFKFILVLAGIPESALNGTGQPEYNIVLAVSEQLTRILVLWFLLVPYPMGWLALVYSTGMGWFVKWIVGHILINRKVVRFKINYWQTFIAPFGAAMMEAGYIWLLKQFLFPLMVNFMGQIPAAIVGLIIGIFTGPFLVYFPSLALLGGLDDGSVEILKKAMEMSGPSKPIVRFILRFCIPITRISPLHNRFPIDQTGIQQEINELIELRKSAKVVLKHA